MKKLVAPPREPDAPLGVESWGAWECFVFFGGIVGFFAVMIMLPSVGG